MTGMYASTGVLLALGAWDVVAAAPPKLLEGLWEFRVQSTENPGAKKTEYSFKLCRDHAYDKQTDDIVKNNKNCTTKIERLASDRFSAASRCTVSGMVIDSKGLSMYRNNTAIHSESAATYMPPLYGKTDETIILDQQYVGACPAGMKPGDRILADGRLVRRPK
jgi:hypothetical protein